MMTTQKRRPPCPYGGGWELYGWHDYHNGKPRSAYPRGELPITILEWNTGWDRAQKDAERARAEAQPAPPRDKEGALGDDMTATNSRSPPQRSPRGVRFVDRDTARDAVEHLRIARNLLADMGAQKAADRVRHALKSAEGAQRHIDGLHTRAFPSGHPLWNGYRPRNSISERLHSVPNDGPAKAANADDTTNTTPADTRL
jgi:hypothetical protein